MLNSVTLVASDDLNCGRLSEPEYRESEHLVYLNTRMCDFPGHEISMSSTGIENTSSLQDLCEKKERVKGNDDGSRKTRIHESGQLTLGGLFWITNKASTCIVNACDNLARKCSCY